MSIPAINLARRLPPGIVSRGARHQLLLLADHADAEFCCWPGQQRLADDQDVSLDTVQRRNGELERVGLITRERRGRKDGGRRSDLYRLHLDAAQCHGGVTPQNAALPKEARSEVMPHPCGVTGGGNAALLRPTDSLNPHLEGTITLSGAAAPVCDQPSIEGSVWPDPLTGDQVRGLIERFGYRTKAGTTIGIVDLIRSASRANGDLSHRDELVEAGLLAVVDSDGNVAPDGDGDCFAITALGESTDVWPYPAGCILPDSDAIAALNEQYELDPFEDYSEQAVPLCGDQERTKQTEQTEQRESSEWIIAMRDVVETCRRDGKMTVGDIVRGAETLGLVTGADDVLKAVKFGLLGDFKRDGMSVTQAAAVDHDLTA
jgi:hypothetical protein